jgi:hypothetical protein
LSPADPDNGSHFSRPPKALPLAPIRKRLLRNRQRRHSSRRRLHENERESPPSPVLHSHSAASDRPWPGVHGQERSPPDPSPPPPSPRTRRPFRDDLSGVAIEDKPVFRPPPTRSSGWGSATPPAPTPTGTHRRRPWLGIEDKLPSPVSTGTSSFVVQVLQNTDIWQLETKLKSLS